MRALAGLVLLAVAPGARAASCQVAAGDLAFGQYRFDSEVSVETEATVSIHDCVDDGSGLDVSYTISISTGGSASYAARAMSGASGTLLLYNLYADAGRSMVWGDGNGGSTTVSGSFTLPGVTSASHTAYGRIPAQQPVDSGFYADMLNITITY